MRPKLTAAQWSRVEELRAECDRHAAEAATQPLRNQRAHHLFMFKKRMDELLEIFATLR